MSEDQDKDSKTEEATEKKVRDALEKGQIAFSRETPIFVSILCFAGYFAFSGDDVIRETAYFLGRILEHSSEEKLDTALDASAMLGTVAYPVMVLLAPVLLFLMAGGLVAALAQNEPRLVAERIAPKFSRISLAKGWKKMVGKQGLGEFVKSVSKLAFASLFVVIALWAAPHRLLDGMFQHTVTFGGVVSAMVLDLLVAVCLAMGIVAAMDLIWSRYLWREELRMTRQEVKDEMKQAEGDPIVKARLRSLARDRSRQRMMSAVPTATLIIANPTHIAIALRYDRAKDAAPLVVAKGQDLIALRIREVAEENNIPVFEQVDLARALNKAVKIDQMIPPAFFKPVAELIRIISSRSTRH